MQLLGIRMELVEPGNNLTTAILEAISRQNLRIEQGDILAIASKAVATSENRLKKLTTVKPSKRAERIAARFDMDPRFAEIVLQEADVVYWGVPHVLLTKKDDILVPNSGVDQKNAPQGSVVLWPLNPHKSAETICQGVYEKTGKRIGVLIVDSRVTPLRMGTTGIAIGVTGFEPIRDHRADKDLYGKRILMTTHALADDLASAAHLVMGESNEQTPAVLIKDAPVKLTHRPRVSDMVIPQKQCLFASHMKPQKIEE